MIIDEKISKYLNESVNISILEKIAKQILHIPTLKQRNSDSLDFYDLGVVSIRRSLEAAYEEGFKEGKNK